MLTTATDDPPATPAARPRCARPGCANVRQPRKRGVCQGCYSTPAVRDQHPPQRPPVVVPDGPSLEPTAMAYILPQPDPEERPEAEEMARRAREASMDEKARRAKLRQSIFTGKDLPVKSALRLTGMTFGQRVKLLRGRKGWSLRQLGERADLTAMALSFLERDVYTPRVSTARQIAVALGETLDCLLSA